MTISIFALKGELNGKTLLLRVLVGYILRSYCTAVTPVPVNLHIM